MAAFTALLCATFAFAKPETKYFDQKIDHFRYDLSTTFKQKYIVDDTFWDTNERNGPLMVYFGNEGEIEDFYDNSGAIFDIAKTFNAMVIFLEHRYYGDSLPFGEDSFTDTNLVYLTVEQALADMARFLYAIPTILQCSSGCNSCQSVLFGGSYGGMLAAWFRVKYPHLSKGALAASAPVDTYLGENRAEMFRNATFHVYKRYGDSGHNISCDGFLSEGLKSILHLSKSEQGRKLISTHLKTCNNVKDSSDAEKTEFYVLGALATLAMLDYPYPTTFVAPLPANPVKYACEQARKELYSENDVDIALLKALNTAINVFVNSTKSLKCHNISLEIVGSPQHKLQSSSKGLGDITRVWNYQACTQMILEPLTSEGLGFAIERDDQVAEVVKNCRSRYPGLVADVDWLKESFGNGCQMARNTRNIIFSDGEKDPWRVGGVPSNAKQISRDGSVVHIYIEGAAHHQDLRSANALDSKSLARARMLEIAEIKKWLTEDCENIQ